MVTQGFLVMCSIRKWKEMEGLGFWEKTYVYQLQIPPDISPGARETIM